MRRIKGFKGFTLIELMIVIAIIAIIAAIAIPGLLQSQRASNERNASASLKTLATAETDLRSNDRDGNHINDFWTLDIAGLFTLYPPGATSFAAIKLIEVSVAAADATNSVARAVTTSTPGSVIITLFGRTAPKAGYWYYALLSDMAQNAPYRVDTDGSGAFHNTSAFGFGAYPDSFSSGRNIFIINEGNTMFKRIVLSNCRAGTTFPPSQVAPVASAATFANPGDDPASWPTDASLVANYGKMD